MAKKEEPAWDESLVDESWDQFTASIRSDYEAHAVKKVLAALGCPGLAREIASESQAATGQASLTFAALAAKLPRLPTRFATATRLKHIDTITVNDFFGTVSRLPFVRAYDEAREALGGSDDFAMVFSWPKVKGGRFMVAREVTETDAAMLGPNTYLWLHRSDRRKDCNGLVVERLADFLTQFDGSTPDEYR